MKYGIIKVKRAFLYEENGVDVVDEVFFGWSVMWEDEGEWIEVWTHYGYRGWMERYLFVFLCIVVFRIVILLYELVCMGCRCYGYILHCFFRNFVLFLGIFL